MDDSSRHGDGSRPGLFAGRSAGTNPKRGTTGLGRFFGRRKSYLIDTAFQIRTALVAVVGMAVLVGFAGVLFHFLSADRARSLLQDAPTLSGSPVDGEGRSILVLLGAGIFFIAIIFVVEILESHKTAGVVLKVTSGLREIESGRWGARVVLRKHDNFKEMEEAFNAATRTLRDRVDGDLHTLQAIEGQVRLIGREIESGNREGALVLLRQVAGEIQTIRESKRNLLRTSGNGSPSAKI